MYLSNSSSYCFVVQIKITLRIFKKYYLRNKRMSKEWDINIVPGFLVISRYLLSMFIWKMFSIRNFVINGIYFTFIFFKICMWTKNIFKAATDKFA